MNLEIFVSFENPLVNFYTNDPEIEFDTRVGYPFAFKTNFLTRGIHTNIVLFPKKIKVEPKPYSNCVNIEKFPPSMFLTMKKMGVEYSREYCLNFYYQQLINENLECFDPT